MSDETPIQRLNEAIHEYVAATDPDLDSGNRAVLGGWVIGFQTTYFEDNGPAIEPIIWAGNYTVSPGLSPFAAAGLAAHVRNVIHKVYVDAQLDDE